MKRRQILLTVLAVALVLSVSIGGAWAYLTARTSAKGGITVNAGPTTDITEPDVSSWVKHVVITNDEDSSPVFVRARGYAGQLYTLTYSGDGWTDGGDGWWYCDEAVEPGGSTPELLVTIGGAPADPENGQSFNVAVLYEATPAVYDASGEPAPDWDLTSDEGTTEGGN